MQEKSDRNIEENEIRLITIIQNSPIGIAFSQDGFTFDANLAYLKLFGYSDISELKGTPLINQIAPQCRADIIERIRNRISGDSSSQTYESIGLRKDGTQFPFLISTNRVMFSDGPLTLAYFTDITDKVENTRKLNQKNEEIEAQNEEYRQLNEELIKAKKAIEIREQQLLEAQKIAQLGYYVLDVTTGNWTSSIILNEIFGINKDYDKTVSGWTEIIHPEERQNMLNYFINEVIGKKSNFDKEYRIVRISDKTMHWVHGKGVLEFDDEGQIIKMMGTIQDITCRKNSEILLKEKNDEIEAQNEDYLSLNEELTDSINKIQTINKELNEAKIKAEDSDKLKSAFLANMSHEIRTPMNGIIGFSEMLTSTDLEKEKQKQFIKIIQDCSNQLLTLVDDLIDISKIESNQLKIDITSINLNDLIYEIYTLLQPKTEKLGIGFNIVPQQNIKHYNVLTDGSRLKQILINLLSNAIKFTKKGQIKFGYTLRQNQGTDVLEFFVEDTGIGIEKKHHEIIFERFRQAEISTGKEFGGTGLGLSISKALVQLLGGKIWVQSEINKGTSFFFTIPFNTAYPVDLQKESDINERKQIIEKHLTILIAEDEPLNYILFKETFSKMNITTIHVENGADAVDYVKADPTISMVLMDLKMPVMNGFDATRLIKNYRKDLPVIAQTAYAQSSDRKKTKEAGCDDYIVKPINLTSLINIINKYI